MSNQDDEDDGWSFPKRPKVKHYITSLMSFKAERWENSYPKSHDFSKEELLQI
jgi:hypothetical protein